MRKLNSVALWCLLGCLPVAHAQTVEHPLTVGNGVLPPKLVHQVDPDFPYPLTRKQRKQGSWTVSISFVVAPDGVPQQFAIVRSSGKAFDEMAMKAVTQYRFTPATRDGIAVAVKLTVDTTFQH